MKRLKILNIFIGLALILLMPVLGFGQETNLLTPPLREEVGSTISSQPILSIQADIKAVVVKSWNCESDEVVFDDLNDNWPLYGSTSIFIDTTLCYVSDITYQDLVNSEADVIILSDPAGGLNHFSISEANAILQYASEGHNVIGTFLVFQWNDVDNRVLAPVFGLSSSIEYNHEKESISNQFAQLDTNNYLFTNIPGPSWTSEGYDRTQTPIDDLKWDPADLIGAELVAECDNYKGMISVYNGGNYTGIYISNMPEYHGGTLDKQLIYNAITYWDLANQPPEAICQDVTVLTEPGLCIADASVDDGSFDPDGEEITLEQVPPGPYDLGDTDVTLTVTDDKGASDTCEATVTVVDEEDPVISSLTANPNKLWPPNHKMVQVTVTVNATDNCDSVCQIVSVESNEPVNGLGSGNTSPDWEITGGSTVNLRAERLGTASGRVYTITVECADSSGNSSTDTATVTVPHDKGKKNNQNNKKKK